MRREGTGCTPRPTRRTRRLTSRARARLGRARRRRRFEPFLRGRDVGVALALIHPSSRRHRSTALGRRRSLGLASLASGPSTPRRTCLAEMSSVVAAGQVLVRLGLLAAPTPRAAAAPHEELLEVRAGRQAGHRGRPVASGAQVSHRTCSASSHSSAARVVPGQATHARASGVRAPGGTCTASSRSPLRRRSRTVAAPHRLAVALGRARRDPGLRRELADPLRNQRRRRAHQDPVRHPAAPVLQEHHQRLDRLAQPHLIGQQGPAAQRPEHAMDGLDLVAVPLDADPARHRQELGEALRAREAVRVERVTQPGERAHRPVEQRGQTRRVDGLDAQRRRLALAARGGIRGPVGLSAAVCIAALPRASDDRGRDALAVTTTSPRDGPHVRASFAGTASRLRTLPMASDVSAASRTARRWRRRRGA